MKSENQTPRDICERTFEFAERIIRLCRTLEGRSFVNRTMAQQVLRSGTSIGANTEEAHGSQSKADFTAKMYIACKEARESHYWLRLLGSAGILPAERLAPLTDEANQLVAILTSIVKKSRKGQ